MVLRLGFIGDGGVSRAVRGALQSDARFEFAAILSRTPPHDRAKALDAFIGASLDVVVEGAGHEAVASFGEPILRSGAALIVVSSGAFADPSVLERLTDAADAGRSKLICAPGALAGIEALAAARHGGLRRVGYRGAQTAGGLAGTAAEGLVDLGALERPATVFKGCARQAARTYPKNANVAATVALAGLGFDRTEVELVADPGIDTNIHELMFEGADGHVDVVVSGQPSQSNPKTSVLTAHSIVRLLVNMASPFVI